MRPLKITKRITKRENDSLEKYFQEVSRVDLITAEDEIDLARRIRNGDTFALEKLVKANLRFVISVAKQCHSNNLSLNDLINEGNLGLIKAATRFDETKGFRFISYAVWWIRRFIIKAIAEQSRIVHIPSNRVIDINKLNRTFSLLEQKFQREPTKDELAAELKLDPLELENTMQIDSRQVSVNAPFRSGDELTLLDILENTEKAPDHQLDFDSLCFDVQQSLSKLTAREADVIALHFGLNGAPLTLEDIGEKLQLTREGVRQIKIKAIKKLQDHVRDKTLELHLD